MEKKHCFPSDSSDPLYLLHNVGMKPCELRSSLLFLEINENHQYNPAEIYLFHHSSRFTEYILVYHLISTIGLFAIHFF